MKIYLIDAAGAVFWLAGHNTEPECTHGSSSGFVKSPKAALQENNFARGANGSFFDRGNLTTEISFTATRTFDTVGAAERFMLQYDRLTSREGAVVMIMADGSMEQLAAAVASPPRMTHRGVTVDISHTVQGGGITLRPVTFDSTVQTFDSTLWTFDSN